jgi:hypothetical protein
MTDRAGSLRASTMCLAHDLAIALGEDIPGFDADRFLAGIRDLGQRDASAALGGWKLMHDNHALATGTEQEVKAAAQEQVTDAHQRYHHDREGLLRAELYLERPDGSHLGQKYDKAGFVPGEPIEWVEVDW